LGLGTKRKLVPLVGVFAALGLNGCMQASDPLFTEYTARMDTITPGAGNDQAVNARIHEIDPWPVYAANVRIPANGERMADAVARSRDVSQLSKTPEPLSLQSTVK